VVVVALAIVEAAVTVVVVASDDDDALVSLHVVEFVVLDTNDRSKVPLNCFVGFVLSSSTDVGVSAVVVSRASLLFATIKTPQNELL